MLNAIASRIPADPDYPARARRIDVLGRVLAGTLYDNLPYAFHDERNGAGEYVPLRDRRPCVRYNLCRIVVQDSVAMLFGGGRFPAIDCADQGAAQSLSALVRESGLNRAMLDAAIRGSVGSVVVHLRILDGRVFWQVLDTGCLTPTWSPTAPDTLIRVSEARKVRGDVLSAMGYPIADDDMAADFWFRRTWDADGETWFDPQRVADARADGSARPVIDAARTVRHGLGFVPMVWIKNLPGGDDIDGGCTFDSAIETQIEIEYQLSQAGRGLKYSSDPTLLIKEPAASDGAQIVKGGDNALVVSENGDAKLLEIGGSASAAVIAYVEVLRKFAIEVIHGNRADADKMSAAQSGRALEIMHQPLIWLADNLRVSYGECGLLSLLRMVVRAGQRQRLIVDGKPVALFPAGTAISLRWPAWFSPTEIDKQVQAGTLVVLRDGGLLSRATAVKEIAPEYDIEDAADELALIASDEAETDARLSIQGAQTKATETLPE